MMGLCTNCETRPIENRDTGLCATCGAMFRKAERQSKKVSIVVPVKKITAKRASQEREYYRLRNQYMEAHPCCEVRDCHEASKECHHMGGRQNEDLLNTDLFLAVCVHHHNKITVDSSWAIENGYSIKRSLTFEPFKR